MLCASVLLPCRNLHSCLCHPGLFVLLLLLVAPPLRLVSLPLLSRKAAQCHRPARWVTYGWRKRAYSVYIQSFPRLAQREENHCHPMARWRHCSDALLEVLPILLFAFRTKKAAQRGGRRENTAAKGRYIKTKLSLLLLLLLSLTHFQNKGIVNLQSELLLL